MDIVEKLTSCLKNKDWDDLTNILKPKDFCGSTPQSRDDFLKLLKVAEILLHKDSNVDEKAQLVLLKCLGNSCVNGYLPKSFDFKTNVPPEVNEYTQIIEEVSGEISYPFTTHFPYNGIVRWIVKTIVNHSAHSQRMTDDRREILRLSLQFLCNLSMSIPKSSNEVDNLMPHILDKNFKDSAVKFVGHDCASIARAACAFIFNMLKKLGKDFYHDMDGKELMTELVKSTMSDIQAALDAIVLLLREPNYMKENYDKLDIDDKLYLLDIVHQEARTKMYNEDQKKSEVFPLDAVTFLSDKFKNKSNLILKTVDSYLKDVEPMEVTIILDILGTISSSNSKESQSLKEDKSLLLNCVFLLKSCHMAGKECKNAFTPVQKLSELTLSPDACPCDDNKTIDGDHICTKTMQAHPAFGFKAALVRIIGNLVHNDEKNQNLVRENDGIPLLLDCCNIDAKNPLIIQWTTLTIRNLCENNCHNQDIIRNCTKLGQVSCTILEQLGMMDGSNAKK